MQPLSSYDLQIEIKSGRFQKELEINSNVTKTSLVDLDFRNEHHFLLVRSEIRFQSSDPLERKQTTP